MIKKIILISLFVINISNIYGQEDINSIIKENDFLQPVNGIFNTNNSTLEYYLKIRKILLKDLSEIPILRFLVIPSFEPTYVLEIQREMTTDKYYIFYNKCNKKIWYNKKWKKIKVKKIKSEISKQSAELIIKLYKNAIYQSKYIKDGLSGNDGTNYYFSVFDQIGSVWSPFENTKTGNLVEISNEIIKLVENAKKEVQFDNNLTKKIEILISEFEK